MRDLIGDLPGFPEPVWHVPNGIASILSFDKAEKHCKITCGDQVFTVHKDDRTVRKFIRADNGLRPWSALDGVNEKDESKNESVPVNTAADEKSSHLVKAHRKAELLWPGRHTR